MSRTIRSFVPVLMGFALIAGTSAGAAIGQCVPMDMGEVQISSPITFAEFCGAFSASALSNAGSSASLLAAITGVEFDFALMPTSIFSTDLVTPQFGAHQLTGDLTLGTDEVSNTLSNCQSKPVTLTTISLSIVCTLNGPDTTYLSNYLPTGLYIALPGNDPGSNGSDKAKFSSAKMMLLTATAVPEPTTAFTFGFGLAGMLAFCLFGYRRAAAWPNISKADQ